MRSARGLALLCGFLKNDDWVLTLSWGSKRIDTKVSILLGLQFPLLDSPAKIGERRPLRNRGTAEDFSSATDGPTSGPSFSYTYSQCQIAFCYTCGSIYAGATQGELPEGQEKVPWGITVSRNSFARYYGRHLRILFDVRFYRRVRQGELPVRAREGALGCDLGAPLQAICTRIIVGAAIGRPHCRQLDADKQYCRSMIHFRFKMQRDIPFRKNLCYTETR